MSGHTKIDLAITNSGDILTVPLWVRDYKINGEDHPLKSRAGDLLLSNEVHHIVTNGNIVTDQDIESAIKSTSNPNPIYQEVEESVFETIFSEEGDNIIDDTIRSFIQDIIIRIRTNSPDFEFHKNIGANLEDLIGEWNKPSVAQYGLNNIVSQLEQIPGMNILYKDAIPISNKTLTFVFRIQGSNRQTLSLKINFDFESGLIIKGGLITI